MNKERGEISVKQLDDNKPFRNFYFDNVYDSKTKQETVFNETALPIIESVMQGYNGTIFAYGQTGTGKTHTMEGTGDDIGIIPRSFSKIFEMIKQKSKNTSYLVRVSYLEIYLEKIRDLLNKTKELNYLEIREHSEKGFYVEDLKEFVVKSPNEMEELQIRGREIRVVAGHDMNERSSRSHSIFTITIDNQYIDDTGKEHIKTGKLNLVDLAGSERQGKTNATGEVLNQAIHINQSLSTLGNVVSALVSGKGHVPYRDSKLTKLLSDSLGGNSKTVMIANIGPANTNYDETVTTLRYADRAKQIKNAPKINEDPKDAMIRQYQEELNRLKDELAMMSGGGINYENMKDENGNINYSQFVSKEKLDELKEKFDKEKLALENDLMSEKKKIVESVNTAEDEKMKLLEELKLKQKEQEKTQAHKSKILEKLKVIEEKFIIGEETEKKAKENELILDKKRKELDEQEKKRVDLQNKIKENEMLATNMKNEYSDIQTEIKEKEKVYKKLMIILKELENEKLDIEKENERQCSDDIELKRQLEDQYKKSSELINYFIPDEYLEYINRELVYDEKNNEILMPIFNVGKNKNLLLESTNSSKQLVLGLHDEEALFTEENIKKENNKIDDTSSTMYLQYEKKSKKVN